MPSVEVSSPDGAGMPLDARMAGPTRKRLNTALTASHKVPASQPASQPVGKKKSVYMRPGRPNRRRRATAQRPPCRTRPSGILHRLAPALTSHHFVQHHPPDINGVLCGESSSCAPAHRCADSHHVTPTFTACIKLVGWRHDTRMRRLLVRGAGAGDLPRQAPPGDVVPATGAVVPPGPGSSALAGGKAAQPGRGVRPNKNIAIARSVVFACARCGPCGGDGEPCGSQ